MKSALLTTCGAHTERSRTTPPPSAEVTVGNSASAPASDFKWPAEGGRVVGGRLEWEVSTSQPAPGTFGGAPALGPLPILSGIAQRSLEFDWLVTSIASVATGTRIVPDIPEQVDHTCPSRTAWPHEPAPVLPAR